MLDRVESFPEKGAGLLPTQFQVSPPSDPVAAPAGSASSTQVTGLTRFTPPVPVLLVVELPPPVVLVVVVERPPLTVLVSNPLPVAACAAAARRELMQLTIPWRCAHSGQTAPAATQSFGLGPVFGRQH